MVSAKDKFDELDFDVELDRLIEAVDDLRTALITDDSEDAEAKLDDAIDYAKNLSDGLDAVRRHLKTEQERA